MRNVIDSVFGQTQLSNGIARTSLQQSLIVMVNQRLHTLSKSQRAVHAHLRNEHCMPFEGKGALAC